MNENSLSLLLVDDEETFAKVLAMHLRDNYGYKTAVVFSGRDAIHTIENSSTGFDVMGYTHISVSVRPTGLQ
jgi:CheY-like chemotaxis protein